MDGLNWPAVLTIVMACLQISLLATTRIAPELVVWGGVLILNLTGVLTSHDALSGLSNEGMVTIGVLFVVVAGLHHTGGVTEFVQRLLSRPRSIAGAQLRMMVPVALASAFTNNTPLVAMMIGPISDWSRRSGIAASKLMMPLSFATILGGCCTLIGTSTNLVVHGLMSGSGLPTFRMLDLAWVGVPAAVAGIAFIVLTQRWLLPDRAPALSLLGDPREYTIEMLVQPTSPLVGQSIEDAGLRSLSGMYLVEIDRDGVVLPAVGPRERLQANDRLVFAGIVESVVELQRFRGLEPATNQVFKLNAPRSERALVEVVVSNRCPLVGQTIRKGRFRNVYDAVVIAVARSGERINQKIGDIELEAGDTLLLEASHDFADRRRNDRDFFLVSRLEGSSPPRHERGWVAATILLAMIALAVLNVLPMLLAAMVAAALMLITRCVTVELARKSIDWSVLLVIAGSFGLGRALETSGAAGWIAQSLTSLGGGRPWVSLALVYLVTLLFTELITNNAAAALMFPIALATSRALGVSFLPFAIVLMMAASAGFATPIGYQTNLMVYGPGGYRFNDYLRLGLPLDFLIAGITIAITPLIWPF